MRAWNDRSASVVAARRDSDRACHRLLSKAPAEPRHDGRQTPYRNHPVFVAQHATATCCRSCLEKWHGIAKGHQLDRDERTYVVEVIGRWIERELATSTEDRNYGTPTSRRS